MIYDTFDINLLSITLRLGLAVIFGGIIGLERGSNKHPAGFRTHILVCVGATLAMLTNQYIFECFGAMSDPGRIGAQVITGVGFLGVGTILVTGHHRIRGLTTAAGLWASACVGLALGIGFYSGAIIAGALIFISLALFPKIEAFFYGRSRIMDLYVEIDSIPHFKDFVQKVRSMNITIFETQLDRSKSTLVGDAAFHISVKIPKNLEIDAVVDELSRFEGVLLVEEL